MNSKDSVTKQEIYNLLKSRRDHYNSNRIGALQRLKSKDLSPDEIMKECLNADRAYILLVELGYLHSALLGDTKEHPL